MPQGKGPNRALLEGTAPEGGRALGVEGEHANAAEKGAPTMSARNAAMSAFITSRAAFEDLDPYAGAGTSEKSWALDEAGLGVSAWLMSLGGDRKITRPYLQNPWVYACIQANARAVSSLPVQVLEGKGDNEKEREGDPLAVLFEAPNPLQSRAKFLKQLVNYHLLWGETYLILLKEQRVGGGEGRGKRTEMLPVPAKKGEGMLAQVETPDEIWPVAGHLVDEVIDPAKGPLPYAYRVHTGGGVVEYPAHAVVQLSDANPHSVLRGVGPMTAVLREAAKGYQIDRYDDALLKNGGAPGGVLTLDGAVGDAELRAIREAWREAHDRPDKDGKTAILSHGTKYQPHGFSPKEMSFSEFREWIRGTIMAVFGVTKPILGITDDVNRANSREAYRVFWETTIIPLVRFFEDELNFKLLRRLADYVGKPVRLAFDTSGVEALREDIDAKVERTLKLYEKGHRTFAEAAELAGWDIGDVQLEGTDERWIQGNLLPPELALEGPPEPPPAPKEGDDENEPEEGDEDQEEPDSDEEPSDEGDEDEGGKASRDAEVDEARETLLDQYWRVHDDYLRGRETRLQKAVFGEFRRFLRWVDGRLVEIASSANALAAPETIVRTVPTEAELERLLDINFEAWSDSMAEAVEPELIGTITGSAQRLQFEIGGGTVGVLDGTDPAVLDFLRGKKVKIVEGYTTNLAKALQRKLVAVLAEAPANLSSLAKAIAEVLEQLQTEVETMQGFAGRRAMMIARTETTSASSFARTEQMRADGIEKHTWLSSRDASTRDKHGPPDGLDGRTRAVGDVFGFRLRYPGDPEGEAADVIQCRCTTIPELPERAVPNIWDFTTSEA